MRLVEHTGSGAAHRTSTYQMLKELRGKLTLDKTKAELSAALAAVADSAEAKMGAIGPIIDRYSSHTHTIMMMQLANDRQTNLCCRSHACMLGWRFNSRSHPLAGSFISLFLRVYDFISSSGSRMWSSEG